MKVSVKGTKVKVPVNRDVKVPVNRDKAERLQVHTSKLSSRLKVRVHTLHMRSRR